MNIQAVNYGSKRLADAPAGSFVLFPAVVEGFGPMGMHVKCPSGDCANVITLRFRRDNKRGGWTWNGDKNTPSLEEQIACKQCGYGWYLKDGVFVTEA